MLKTNKLNGDPSVSTLPVACFSIDSSATSRFSRAFSFSNSFSRLAWSSFSPPYSFRQR